MMTVDQLKEHLEKFPGYWPVAVEIDTEDPDGFTERTRSEVSETYAGTQSIGYGNHSTVVVIR